MKTMRSNPYPNEGALAPRHKRDDLSFEPLLKLGEGTLSMTLAS